jgi:putative hydrolase
MNDPGDQVPDFMRDLMKMLGGGQSADAWLDAARALAVQVATDGTPEANADPLRRMELEELARVAELRVADVAGLPPLPATVRFTAVGRGTWAQRELEGWRPVMENVVAAQQAASRPDAGAVEGGTPAWPGDLGSAGMGGLEEFLGQVAQTMGPLLCGLQFGSAAGHLAQHALGQFALPLPRPSAELAVVPENVARFAEDWSLAVDQTQLWVCTRDLTACAVLNLPHVASRVTELLSGLAAESAAAQQGLAERLGAPGDPAELQELLSDPESLLADLLTPGQRRSSAQLVAVTTALGAYVDHVTALVAEQLFGSTGTLAEAWYRHRTSDAAGVQAAAALFGLDLSRAEVDRGAAFVDLGLQPPDARRGRCAGPVARADRPGRPRTGLAAQAEAGSSVNPRSQSKVRCSRSASRTTRSRLRRNCGSWGGRSTRRARTRSRKASMVAGSPKSDWTSQCGATGPR